MAGKALLKRRVGIPEWGKMSPGEEGVKYITFSFEFTFDPSV